MDLTFDSDSLGTSSDPVFEINFAVDQIFDGMQDLGEGVMNMASSGEVMLHDGAYVVMDPSLAAEQLWDGIEAIVDGAASLVSTSYILNPFETFEVLNGGFDSFDFSGFDELNNTYGTPAEDMALWDYQDDLNSCAVATTSMLFRAFGYDFGESLLADCFEITGSYDPSLGTQVALIDDTINSISEALNLGLVSTEINGFNAADLGQMLDSGVRPLIAVNALALSPDSMTQTLNDLGVLPDSGHAVQLIGIVETPEGSCAIINDPGYPDGAGRQIPLDAFMSAAADMNNQGVAMFQV
jgi:hypothetical protein